MPDYSKGKIYTIRFHNSNEIYIGSTTQSLAVRFGGHKRGGSFRCSLYKIINSKYNGDWSVCYYELYENFSCNTKEELCKKEGEMIRKFKDDENYNCINFRIAGRTGIECCKQYYQENINIVKEKQKQYKEENANKIKEYNKKYKEENANKIKEYNKKYREENANKIKENNKEKITCDCGYRVNKNSISRHYKSKIHQEYLTSL
jgi:hypothetical protein